MVENLLSKIVVIPQYLTADECQRLVADLDSREATIDLGIYTGARAPMTSPFTFADIADPFLLVSTVHNSQVADVTMTAYLVPEAMPRVARVQHVSDLDEELGVYLLNALNQAVGDPEFFCKFRSLLSLSAYPGLQGTYAQLKEAKLYVEEGEALLVKEDLSDAERFALTWFNVDLLESVVFPGALLKSNRLFDKDADTHRISQLLSDPPGPHPDVPVFGAWLQQSTDFADVCPSDSSFQFFQYAIARLFAQSPPRRRFLKDYLPVTFEYLPENVQYAAEKFLAQEKAEDDVEVALVWSILYQFLPHDMREYSGALTAAVNTGIRNTQTVDLGDSAEACYSYLERLRSNFIEPYYKIPILADYSDISVLRYEAGGIFLTHCDSEKLAFEDGKKTWVKWIERDVSILIYLSDERSFKGGQLTFPNQNITIRPKQGMAIMFPSDHRFPHCAELVEQGRRYAIVGWLKHHGAAAVGCRNQAILW
jgi:hypothetical protein